MYKKKFILNHYVYLLFITLIVNTLQGCNKDSSKRPLDNHDSSINSDKKEEPLVQESGEKPQSKEHDSAMYQLTDTVKHHQYLAEGYTKTNDHPYPSELVKGHQVSVYLDDNNIKEFLKIEPETRDTFATLQPGATLIQEVWDPQEGLKMYNVMIKKEPGFFPEGGDYIYGQLDADGTIKKSGKLIECSSCHQGRENDDFLFGTAKEHRVPVAEHENIDAQMDSLILGLMPDKKHFGEGFEKINTVDFRSKLNSDNFIDVYVSSFAADSFKKVSPNETGSQARMPEDTVIIREVKNEQGELIKYTAMIKGPKDYFPDGGNYYYAVLNPDGTFAKDDKNQAIKGKLNTCGNCHLRRDTDDYLFGVDSTNHQ